MSPLVRDRLDALAGICRAHRVRKLELFGSAARDGFDPDRSDLDFLVEFLPSESGGYFDNYFDLLEQLQALFGRSVDLVIAPAIRNRYFLESVNRNRVTLYAA